MVRGGLVRVRCGESDVSEWWPEFEIWPEKFLGEVKVVTSTLTTPDFQIVIVGVVTTGRFGADCVPLQGYPT